MGNYKHKKVTQHCDVWREKSQQSQVHVGALLVSQGQDLPEHHLKHHSWAEAEGLGWEGKGEGSVSRSPSATGSFLNRCVSTLRSGQVQSGGDSRRELQVPRTVKLETQPRAEHPTAKL